MGEYVCVCVRLLGRPVTGVPQRPDSLRHDQVHWESAGTLSGILTSLTTRTERHAVFALVWCGLPHSARTSISAKFKYQKTYKITEQLFNMCVCVCVGTDHLHFPHCSSLIRTSFSAFIFCLWLMEAWRLVSAARRLLWDIYSYTSHTHTGTGNARAHSSHTYRQTVHLKTEVDTARHKQINRLCLCRVSQCFHHGEAAWLH